MTFRRSFIGRTWEKASWLFIQGDQTDKPFLRQVPTAPSLFADSLETSRKSKNELHVRGNGALSEARFRQLQGHRIWQPCNCHPVQVEWKEKIWRTADERHMPDSTTLHTPRSQGVCQIANSGEGAPVVDTTRCPICGAPNNCCQAASGASSVLDCWCIYERFPAGLLELVPPALKNRACICRDCLESHETNLSS